jgi:hypothetical protein
MVDGALNCVMKIIHVEKKLTGMPVNNQMVELLVKKIQ